MSDALPLPPRPNLEQYKKLAKDFQHACKSSETGAIRDWAARWRFYFAFCVPVVRSAAGTRFK